MTHAIPKATGHRWTIPASRDALELFVELSSSLQVQHSAAYSRSKVISLESLVRSHATAATPPPHSESKPEPQSSGLLQQHQSQVVVNGDIMKEFHHRHGCKGWHRYTTGPRSWGAHSDMSRQKRKRKSRARGGRRLGEVVSIMAASLSQLLTLINTGETTCFPLPAIWPVSWLSLL